MRLLCTWLAPDMGTSACRAPSKRTVTRSLACTFHAGIARHLCAVPARMCDTMRVGMWHGCIEELPADCAGPLRKSAWSCTNPLFARSVEFCGLGCSASAQVHYGMVLPSGFTHPQAIGPFGAPVSENCGTWLHLSNMFIARTDRKKMIADQTNWHWIFPKVDELLAAARVGGCADEQAGGGRARAQPPPRRRAAGPGEGPVAGQRAGRLGCRVWRLAAGPGQGAAAGRRAGRPEKGNQSARRRSLSTGSLLSRAADVGWCRCRP